MSGEIGMVMPFGIKEKKKRPELELLTHAFP